MIASVGAGLVVAATQGAIGGLAFWLLGLRAAVFWGVVTAFCGAPFFALVLRTTRGGVA